MEIEIRSARKEDEEELARLVTQFKREHSEMIGGEGDFALDAAREEVAERMAGEDEGYFVAVDGDGPDHLLGYRRWKLEEEIYFSKELYVVPESRRSGVARALIGHFEDWLLDRDQEIACISCTPHNMAMIGLARSEGYNVLNTIEMRKNLTDSAREPRGRKEALGFTWKVL